MTMDNALSTTVFLKDLNDFAKMNAVYAEFFKERTAGAATRRGGAAATRCQSGNRE